MHVEALQLSAPASAPASEVSRRLGMSMQHAGYTFIPASLEASGSQGQPIVGNLRTLSDIAAGRTLGVSRGSFLVSALRELSVALVRSQGSVYRPSATFLLGPLVDLGSRFRS
jgi:hypothetical protein